jgi:hypothetical protein
MPYAFWYKTPLFLAGVPEGEPHRMNNAQVDKPRGIFSFR